MAPWEGEIRSAYTKLRATAEQSVFRCVQVQAAHPLKERCEAGLPKDPGPNAWPHPLLRSLLVFILLKAFPWWLNMISPAFRGRYRLLETHGWFFRTPLRRQGCLFIQGENSLSDPQRTRVCQCLAIYYIFKHTPQVCLLNNVLPPWSTL